ncbi:MAG: FAD-binding oxidoreductase [Acidobacteria bacterium]|nr:FAD-binding oxidoreductase [Acidobacteriota bacterium]
MTEPTMPIALPSGDLRVRFAGESLPAEVIHSLTERGIHFTLDADQRHDHGRDWWPLTIGWAAHGEVPALPGVVVQPVTTEEVAAVLRIANEHRVPVTPQGGRSGVVGGAIPATGGIALDLTKMNSIVTIDEESMTVTVESGCFGPDLENYLQERGLTVGHFPQSFDLATVGGWLACRGAGQLSNRYGKIEDIVRGLTVVLADGTIVTTGNRGPRAAVGPDLTQVFVGSEGTLGIITSATLTLRRHADYREIAAYSFASVHDGLEACRRIIQRDARPAVLRLYDVPESQRNFHLDRCALVVLDEGEVEYVATTMKIVSEECVGAQREDDSVVHHWLEHRNNVSALTPLWSRDIVVDTIEIAGPWSTLMPIYEAVTAAILAVPSSVTATMHQSHAYQDGACLYFTFAGRPESDLEGYYRSVWDAASAAVLEHGGALSHHHGVGRNRARFVPDALGSGFDVLARIKDSLDPHHILNPGVLGLGGVAW